MDKIIEAMRAQGATEADVEAYLRSQGAVEAPAVPEAETTGEKIAGGISSAYQGLTLGAGNKITAALRTIFPEAIGGTRGFDFPTALREQTDILEGYRAKHPVASTALELAGSVPTVMVGGASALAGDMSKIRRAWELAKVGGKFGTATGALSANELEDVIPGAAIGGGLGFVAAPVIGATTGAAARGISRVGSRIPGRVGGMFGRMADALGAKPSDVESRAEDMVAGALRAGGVDPAAAATTLPVGLPTTAMELGSPNVSRLARAARNVPTSSAQKTLDEFLGERGTASGGRIAGALAKGTGMRPTDTSLPVELMTSKKLAEAAPAYEKAFAYGEIKDPETIALVKQLRRDSFMKDAWERGQKISRMEEGGTAAPPAGIDAARFAELKAQGLDKFLPKSMTTEAAPTVRELNAWKLGLDAKIEAGAGSTNALSRNEARLYRKQLGAVMDRIDAEVPDYKAARAIYRGNAEMSEAAEAGAQHMDPSVQIAEVKRKWGTLTPGEQDMYRWNALNAATTRVQKVAANMDIPDAARAKNVVQHLMGTADAGARLKMLFPDEKAYQEFIGKMEQEALYPKTTRALTGQSSTAAQVAEGGIAGHTWRDLALAGAGSRYGQWRLVEDLLRKMGVGAGMTAPVADEIAKRVVLTGTPLEEMLVRMGASPRRIEASHAANKAATRLLGIGAGKVGGLLSQ